MRDLLTLVFNNYSFYLWLVIAVIPAVLFRFWKTAKIGSSVAKRTGYWLLVLAAGLAWSNGLFFVNHYFTLSRAVQIAAFTLTSVLFGLLLVPVCLVLLRLIDRIAHNRLFSGNALFFALSAIWLVQLVLLMPETLNGWHTSSYVVNYSMGFSSRFMIGSILRLIAGDFVSAKEIYWFCFAFYVILILLSGALLNYFYKSIPQKNQPAAMFGIACFVACPGSIAALWGNDSIFGKLDFYGLLISLLGVIVFHKIRSVPLRYLCLTLCACFAIAIYQGYVFLYYSILAVVMIGDLMRESEQDSRRTRIICSALSVAVTGVCFMCFQFISTIPFADAEEMFAVLQTHTDVDMAVKAIEFEYFAPLQDAYYLVTKMIFERTGRLMIWVELLLLSPLIFMIAYTIICYGRQGKGLRRIRNGFDLSLLTILFVLPQFLLNQDWGRWITAMMIDLAFIFAYRLYCGDTQLSGLAERLSERLRKNPLPAVLAVLYLSILQKYAVLLPSFDVDNVIQFFVRILR